MANSRKPIKRSAYSDIYRKVDTSFSNEYFNYCNTIPRILHLIWMGSNLRLNHVERLKQWVALNPDYDIQVWIDREFKQEIVEQLKGINITLRCIDEIVISEKEKIYINKFVEKSTNPKDLSIPNWAAKSDFKRFYILNKKGGWYSDFDIKPIDFNTVKINPSINFCFHGFIFGNKNEQDINFGPGVLASVAGGMFTELALEIIAKMAEQNDADIISLVRSNDAMVRRTATGFYTGAILNCVLSRLMIKDGKCIITGIRASKELPRADKTLFNLAARYFANNPESSWIFSDVILMENAQIGVIPLPNIDMDDEFVGVHFFGQPMKKETAERMKPIEDLVLERCDKILQSIEKRDLFPMNEQKRFRM